MRKIIIALLLATFVISGASMTGCGKSVDPEMKLKLKKQRLKKDPLNVGTTGLMQERLLNLCVAPFFILADLGADSVLDPTAANPLNGEYTAGEFAAA